MPKIVIDARESGTTTGRYVDKLVEHLHRLEPKEEIIILAKTPRLAHFKAIAPSFKVVKSDYKEFTFSEQYGLTWQLYGIKNNLVHFPMIHQPVLYFGKTVTSMHDLTTARFRNPSKNWLIFKLKQLIYRGVIIWVAHKSKNIITISEYVKKDLTRFAKVRPSKIFVTYPAAEKITEPAQPVKRLAGERFIMYVGRPLPHKNLWRLVEAFQILKETQPDLSLVLAGRKDVLYQKIEKKITKKRIGGVYFAGFVSEGQLRWLYENTAAYVFPSLSEGFGLPGLEAMVHGAPVVSSNATCLPEIYGSAAHYFDPLNIADMAAKIDEVLDQPELRANLVAAGKKQAAKYSWQRMAQQTLAIYRKNT